MLYQPDRHQPLTGPTWDPELARTTIVRLLTSTLDAYSPIDRWPLPIAAEVGENWQGQPPTSIYLGAMGVLWVLDYLQDYLPTELSFDKQQLALDLYQQYFNSEGRVFAGDDGLLPSYLLGETGILLVLGKLVPSTKVTNRTRQMRLIEKNISNPTLEPLWGGTGSVIPLLFDLEAELSQASEDLFVSHCEFMKSKLTKDTATGSPIWTQDLYGEKRCYTGAGHGFAGNIYPFIRGRSFLPADLAQWSLDTAVDMIVKTAVVEGDCANWPSLLGVQDPQRPRFRVQWCHGAPGVIVALNDIPIGYNQDFDKLMLKAGETIWQAGPLHKGVNLCHGTDGNGFAFLKLHERTGDPKWLERARAFAMHALAQTNNRHALWDGDLSLPCFLHACLTQEGGFPLLDIC